MNVKSFDEALDFVPATAGRTHGLWQIVTSSFASISEGIRLASDYKTLTAAGMAPDVAVRKVFEQIKR